MGSMELRPYGADSQVITVTKQVRLGSLKFKAVGGPLMFRGLRNLKVRLTTMVQCVFSWMPRWPWRLTRACQEQRRQWLVDVFRLKFGRDPR
ncbi:hypothetical protein H257_16950 [Aphanomyces astaci]|uniref:Uncharacterized protein n=1 Tax=Aphanomyces astaci TaxID=112090 RepID=W4FIJ7_APHAT|nr:hypothetical protein H257_16950 [Aphanomyces astaci]ETV66646.1 hypothetical protein H257_16950 [Aphanomyces astaci]|eukprot:XP_009843874.1 hypothetical protein H257_16950 [Aphanomyces astaci]